MILEALSTHKKATTSERWARAGADHFIKSSQNSHEQST